MKAAHESNSRERKQSSQAEGEYNDRNDREK
jgi:hypothetical protein